VLSCLNISLLCVHFYSVLYIENSENVFINSSSLYTGPPKVMTIFQTAVLIRRSNFCRKCKVEMKEHMLEIVHKLCPENHLW
jgi:hypothetical protein